MTGWLTVPAPSPSNTPAARLTWTDSVVAVSVRPGMPSKPAPEMSAVIASQLRVSVEPGASVPGVSDASASRPPVTRKPTPGTPMKTSVTLRPSVTRLALWRSPPTPGVKVPSASTSTSTRCDSKAKPTVPDTRSKRSMSTTPVARTKSPVKSIV